VQHCLVGSEMCIRDRYYAVFNLLAPGGALDEVERTLKLADDVLRHKLLRLPDQEAASRGMIAAKA
jgi:small subunit ribosomal protein S6